jgi:hypothetical protein
MAPLRRPPPPAPRRLITSPVRRNWQNWPSVGRGSAWWPSGTVFRALPRSKVSRTGPRRLPRSRKVSRNEAKLQSPGHSPRSRRPHVRPDVAHSRPRARTRRAGRVRRPLPPKTRPRANGPPRRRKPPRRTKAARRPKGWSCSSGRTDLLWPRSWRRRVGNGIPSARPALTLAGFIA